MTSYRHRLRAFLAMLGISGALAVTGLAHLAVAHAETALTDVDLTRIAGPQAADIAEKGDPGAEMTGTINDVPVSNAKRGLTLADVVNQIGQNKIAINFTWTLICGFLVMFMQAGFAMVETGLIRAKNANHTMMMNFMVYGLGLFAYWVCGFAIQMGGCAPSRTWVVCIR